MKLLNMLDESQRARLESRCRWRRYKNGEKVFDRGDEGRDVFFVVEGRVNAVDFTLSGREVAFASIKEGDSFGELAAIDGLPRSTSVVAAENSYLAALPHDADEALTYVRLRLAGGDVPGHGHHRREDGGAIGRGIGRVGHGVNPSGDHLANRQPEV